MISLFIGTVILGSIMSTVALELPLQRTEGYDGLQEEQQQKEILQVIDVKDRQLSPKERGSIPFIGVRPYYVPSKYLSNSYEKLLVVNKEVIGAIGYYYWICNCDSAATITNIGIEPRYQKKGYGKYLMHYFLDEARKKRTDIVTLQPMNGSEKFHKKFGFRTGADTLLHNSQRYMVLKLNTSPPTSPSSPSESSST